MAATVWNSLNGYVMISIEGLALERLLNHAARERVRLWGVKRISRTRLTANVGVKDFYRLQRLRRKTNCRIHILEKHGATFLYLRMRFRKVLLVGWALILALILLASRYVWFVKVEGCYKVTEKEVVALLEQMDIRPGVRSDTIDSYALGRALSSADERIAWAGVQRLGVTLTVEIIEAKILPEPQQDDGPASVYAKKAAVIKHVTALEGHPAVKEGDAVLEGDLLITGDLSEGRQEPYYVSARGEVIARVAYQASAVQAATEMALVRTGVSVPYCRVSLWGYEVFLRPEQYLDWEFSAKTSTKINATFLPFSVEFGRLYEKGEREVALAKAQMEERALLAAQTKAFLQIPGDARIVGKRSEIEFLEDGCARATVYIETEEDIAVQKPL